MAQTILRIDASARMAGSYSRDLTDRVVDRLETGESKLIRRDLGANPPSIITEDWVNANFTPDADRTNAQNQVLAESDALIAELQAADTLVIGLPMYNFGVPAAFKAWIDQVARARKTFQYTANGPEGLLHGKRAYVIVTSGGTKTGSNIDFVTSYARHMLGFLGIKDVTIITADELMMNEEVSLSGARTRIDAVAA